MKNQILTFFVALVTNGKKPIKSFSTSYVAPWEPYVLPLYLLAGLKSSENHTTVDTWALAEMLTTKQYMHERIATMLNRFARHTDKENADYLLAVLTTGMNESIEPTPLGNFDSEYGNIMQDFNYYEMTKALWLGRAVTGPYKTVDQSIATIFGKNILRKRRRVLKECINTLAEMTKYEPKKVAAMLVTGGYRLIK